MSLFKNKKPGTSSNVKVNTTIKKSKQITDESLNIQQKKRKLESQTSPTVEKRDIKSDKLNYKGNWLRDNDTPVERHPITLKSVDNGLFDNTISSKQLVDMNIKQYIRCTFLFIRIFNFDDFSAENVPTITLTLPGRAFEEFPLLIPKNNENYSPLHDLIKTITLLVHHFVPPSSQSLFGVIPEDDADFITSNDTNILRLIQRSFNRREGTSFCNAVETFNKRFLELIDKNEITNHLNNAKGIHPRVWQHISDQTYQRVVGPRVNELRQYEAFSSNIYGEILSPFVAHIAHKLNIGPNSTFIDLGAGVGNLVLQMSLATGCKSFGVEQMNTPADLGFIQLEEGTKRSAMYGLLVGDMDFEKGDMCNSQKLNGLLPKADYILVNNSFSAELNERLSLIFLDLKDGVKIVSLKPFLSNNFRITDATVNSPLAILEMEKGEYFAGSVSWTDAGGSYYVHRVDRSKLNSYLKSK
ncbi:DOT1-domain-containing protein [Wallemia mellicola]|nr:hypothetical protein E3Q24_02306 [Wallemia mellicola]TIC01703.1 DOT1-domain-containing protein [Wallemia mellicola]TIC08946.1 DOT1-domain-containing protein [Wallemia mellicola]TIC22593.1 DOT1-domain-containing protein [Wallemia mellicola]TIC24886.1 DOT1-domain-containing protein [Wallemia mellicola]